jgi:hypothetical protein
MRMHHEPIRLVSRSSSALVCIVGPAFDEVVLPWRETEPPLMGFHVSVAPSVVSFFSHRAQTITRSAS